MGWATGSGRRIGRACDIAAMLVLLAGVGPACAREGGSIATTDLCADQAVFALVEPDRIAGLSRWSRDPAISPVADANLPVIPDTAESLLMSGAGTVITDRNETTTRLLEKLGIHVLTIQDANDFPSIFNVLNDTGEKLNERERARRLTASLRQRLDRVREKAPADGPLALYLRPDGGTAGSATPVDAALTAAGYRNLAAQRGLRGWGPVDLEDLVMHPPEVVVTSFFTSTLSSWQSAFSHHPAFARTLAQARRIEIPGALWSCGGWPLVEAAERLAAARNAP